jgi:hypothetical protein
MLSRLDPRQAVTEGKRRSAMTSGHKTNHLALRAALDNSHPRTGFGLVNFNCPKISHVWIVVPFYFSCRSEWLSIRRQAGVV